MSKVSFVKAGDDLVLAFHENGNISSVCVKKDHPNFIAIRNGLKDKSPSELMALISKDNVQEAVKKIAKDLTKDRLTVKNGVVYWDNSPVEQCLTDAFNELEDGDLPVEGMIAFIERLYNNLSARNRKVLLTFVERNGLTINSKGFLVAYKAVRSDYYDKWSGTIKYSVGTTVEMERGTVNDDFRVHCSKGLHAGALQYVYSYGGGSDRIVVVEIDPADVVSVPEDFNCQKLRTCKLTVIGDYQGELKQTVYDADASLDERYEDDYDLDYDDDDDDFDWSEVEDSFDDDFDDDDFDDHIDEGDVTVSQQEDDSCEYGVKPSGRKYWNRRDDKGRFA